MKSTQDSYPFFKANQVLSNTHLNQGFNYLEEQERLTRANLIGIGIVCGLEIRLEKTASQTKIHLNKGCGITSEGYLIVEPAVIELVSYREKYILPSDLPYQTFKTGQAKDALQYNLWELFPAGEPNTTPLDALEKLDEKAVVLFLELKKEPLRNCSPNNCDDKGAEVTAKVRRLLVEKDNLKNILATATELDTKLTDADLESILSARLNLPDLRLPRYDVPNTAPVTTKDVLAAFLTVFQAGKLVTQTAKALTAAYNAFESLVQDIYPNNPFANFTTKFGFLESAPILEGAPIKAEQVRFLQYYYDFFDDLFRAYDEFRSKGTALLCACCPPEKLFPRHLMLGVLAPSNVQNPNIYRHHFLASATVGGCEERTKEVILLFQRMVTMIAAFTDESLPLESVRNSSEDSPIRITPSTLGDKPLSEKAIPYYYQQSGDPLLFKLWNADKTRRNKADQNLAYRSDKYQPPAPAFVTNALDYDLEQYNFLRIEGHLGKDYEKAVKNLLDLKSRYRLPIDIIALSTGKELDSFLGKNPGIQHKAGVPIGGTFVVVYHNKSAQSLLGATSAANKANTSNVAPKGSQEIISEALEWIPDGTIIADFYLPYQRTDSAKYNYPIVVRECEHKWIDSIRHIYNLSLRDYRFKRTEKAPAANEQERIRLQDNYIIRIYKYEIQGKSMLTRDNYRDIEIPISSLQKEQVSAIVRKLNEAFPLGLVFDCQSATGNIFIRHVDGHTFRIELGGVQGNQIRYAYENNRFFRWQEQAWEELGQRSDSRDSCRIVGGLDYNEEEYKWLHEHEKYKPRYPQPKPELKPTAKEVIQWEKRTLSRARSAIQLPIYDRVLKPLCDEIEKIDPNAKIVLIGSWANGSWISRNKNENQFETQEEQESFLHLREKVTGKTGPNDINLLLESDYEITPDMIRVSSGYNVNIFKGKKDAQKGLVLK